jgi:hypothetical protein
MWVSLSLSSGLAQKVGTRHRFYLDDLIHSVARVHLVTLEVTDVGYLSPRPLYFYFSEHAGYGKIVFFKAEVPVGKYSPDLLTSTLEMSVACAKSLNYPNELPANAYKFRLHQETGTITIKSNGICSFSVHNTCHSYAGHVTHVLSGRTIRVALDGNDIGIAKGSLVQVFGENTEVVRAQVVDVGVDMILVLELSLDVSVPVFSKVTVQALSATDSIHHLLGLGDRDIHSDEWQPINAVGTYVVEDSGSLDSDLLLSTTLPTGVKQGDTLQVRTPAGAFFNGVVDYARGLYTAVKISESAPVHQLKECRAATAGRGTVCQGPNQADLENNKRVAYVRLWLGSTEVSSIVVPNSRQPLVFGRVQLQCPVARSFDGSLVGEKTFSPPVEKVPHVDVEFLDEEGRPYTGVAAWNHWSALLRLSVSNASHLCRLGGEVRRLDYSDLK